MENILKDKVIIELGGDSKDIVIALLDVLSALSDDDIQMLHNAVRCGDLEIITETLVDELSVIKDVSRTNQRERLLDIAGILLVLCSAGEEMEAESKLEDVEGEQATAQYYIDLANSFDLNDLTIDDLANVSPQAMAIIIDARAGGGVSELDARIREIARLVYVMETNFIPEEVQKELIESLRSRRDSYAKAILRHTKGGK